MKICDINPFIRYANASNFSPINDFVYSYDSRIFYVLEGNFKIIIEDNEYNIYPDTLMLWRAGTKYRFITDTNSDIKMIIFNFDYCQAANKLSESISPVLAKNFKISKITHREAFDDCKSLNEPLILEDMQSIKKKLLNAAELFNTLKVFKSERSSSILKEVLTSIAAISVYTDEKTYDIVNTVLEYLKENFKNEITNKEIGKLIGYHPYYVNRLMLKYTKTTLRQHLIILRIENAKELLSKSDMPISNIAEQCGFNSSSHFSNLFKEKVGLNPASYRKKYQNFI